MNKGKVKITRIKQYANKFRKISIYINDSKIGEIKDGQTKVFEVDAGINEIYVEIDWCKTKPLKLNIDNNQIRIRFQFKRVEIITKYLLYYTKLLRITILKKEKPRN